MSNLLYGDAVSEFQTAMFEDLGIWIDEIVPDGIIHRPDVDGRKNIAYKLHLNGCPAGYYQDFKQGIKRSWRAATFRNAYSDDERQAFKLRMIEEQRQRQKDNLALKQQATIRAKSKWNNASKLHVNHNYLVKKQVQPNNARFHDEAIVIPVYNRYKQLTSLQFINPDGTKRFLKGGQLKCCFSVIGRTSGQPLAICEGWATGASIHEHRGHQVFIAFSANNLEPVARVLRDIFPEREIFIFGDNDPSGVGQKSAHAAADAVDGTVLIPPMIGTDWNDHFTRKPQGITQ